MRFVLSRPALQDVESIGDWIARDDPVRADSFVEEIEECCARLARHPEAFPIDPDFVKQQIRRRSFGHYVIFYRMERDRVVVVGVLNSARDAGAILRTRLS